jgi:PleD family two-component response regulator
MAALLPVTVKSGLGTIFKIHLPSLSEHSIPETEMLELTPVGTERILLIDDEPMLAEMGKTMLERLGYTVTVRMNSFEASPHSQINQMLLIW